MDHASYPQILTQFFDSPLTVGPFNVHKMALSQSGLISRSPRQTDLLTAKTAAKTIFSTSRNRHRAGRGTTFSTTRSTALITLSTIVIRNRFFLAQPRRAGRAEVAQKPIPSVLSHGKATFTRDIVDLDFDEEEYVDYADTLYPVRARPASVPAVADRGPSRSSAPRAASAKRWVCTSR